MRYANCTADATMNRRLRRLLAGVGVLTLVFGAGRAAAAPDVSPMPSFLERVGDRLFFGTYDEATGVGSCA